MKKNMLLSAALALVVTMCNPITGQPINAPNPPTFVPAPPPSFTPKPPNFPTVPPAPVHH